MYIKIRVAAGLILFYIFTVVYIGVKLNDITDADLITNAKIGLVPFLKIPVNTYDFLLFGMMISLILFFVTLLIFLDLYLSISYEEFSWQRDVHTQIHWLSLFIIDSWISPLLLYRKNGRLLRLVKKIIVSIILYFLFDVCVASGVIQRIRENESYLFELPFYLMSIFADIFLVFVIYTVVLQSKKAVFRILLTLSAVICATYMAVGAYVSLVENTHQNLLVCGESRKNLPADVREKYCRQYHDVLVDIYKKYFAFSYTFIKKHDGITYTIWLALGDVYRPRQPLLWYQNIERHEIGKINQSGDKFEGEIDGAKLNGINIKNAQMYHVFAPFSLIQYSNLDGLRAIYSDFSNSFFSNNKMEFAIFESAKMSNITFFQQNSNYTYFTMADMRDASIENSVLKHDIFNDAKLYNSKFKYDILKNDSFSGADLKNSVFSNSYISGTSFSLADMECDLFVNVSFKSPIGSHHGGVSMPPDLRNAVFMGGDYRDFVELTRADSRGACTIGKVSFPEGFSVPECGKLVYQRCPSIHKAIVSALYLPRWMQNELHP